MSTFPRPDIGLDKNLQHTCLGAVEGRVRLRAIASPRYLRIWCFCTLLVLGFSGTHGMAQGAGPQRAIEALEGCSAKERKQGCINILTRRSLDENKQAIKAQVRGGRIIWYEFNSKTGRVRRTN
jgi:hypothetical protein